MRKILLLFTILFTTHAFASHNKAGEITYRLVSGLTYEITVVTYTENGNDESRHADRPQIDIDWGDGTTSTVNRLSQEDLPNTTWKNTYVARHTYRGPGVFKVSFRDPNRIANVVNMNNSYLTAFYLECVIHISPFLGTNSSPILKLSPIDRGCVGQIFKHNPGAFDPDGDSLTFEIIPPKQSKTEDVFGFDIPKHSIKFEIDPLTGELVWQVPQFPGIYNIAIKITEYRNGVEIGYVVRDMQITISGNCVNRPPVIDDIKDTCIEVGKTLNLPVPVHASDPDNDFIKMTAYGAPFDFGGNKAVFNPAVAVGKGNVTATFSWKPSCDHIRRYPYQVIIRAEDQRAATDVNLVDLKAFNIRVIGPSPKNPTIKQFEDGFVLNWKQDSCTRAVGYNIYRRLDSSHWSPDYCETGVPAYTGFRLYDTVRNYQNTQYYDNDFGLGLTPGTRYCYRIVSYYAPLGNNNVPIYSAVAESYASLEVCGEIIKDRPVLTNVSVQRTHADSGKMYVAWSKPIRVDSINYPPPYKYVIYRSEGQDGSNFKLLDSIARPSFALMNDTTYIDSMALNTKEKSYSYKVEFYSDSFNLKRKYIGKSKPASSIFLELIPDDEAMILRWTDKVQWKNKRHVIYKLNETTSVFDSIAQTDFPEFRDDSLINGKAYYYYIKSVGEFDVPGYVYPVINFSQIAVNHPWDTTPPCPPIVNATADCDLYRNKVNWNNPNNTCAKDVIGYHLYFRSILDTSFVLVDSITGPDNVNFDDFRALLRKSVAGCYRVTAIDSFQNESELSSPACVDNCPIYQLPNVFTPGTDDTINKYFIPYPYRFVKQVNMRIFNRWGEQVYKTENPDIMWDGSDARSHKYVADGTYFYICDVYEYRLDGLKKRTIKGTIQVIFP